MKNKVLTLLLSLVISFGLWLYVVTVISPESEATFYNVPVELVGTEYLDAHDLIMISDTGNLRMNLTLRGTRSDLSKLSSSNITIIADLSNITRPGEHQLDCKVSFQSGTAEVVAQTPEYITVVVAEQTTKNVPVKVRFTGNTPSGYQADQDESSVSMDHSTVTVKGPKEVVEQIDHAGITVDITGKMTTFVADYPLTLYGANLQPLVNDQYVTTNVVEIRAGVTIRKVKTATVRINVDCTGSGLHEGLITVTPAPKEVTLIGTDEALAKADEELVFDIKLSDYQKEPFETLIPTLPAGIECKETIRFYISIPNMTSKVFSISEMNADQFRWENLPEGLSVQLTSTSSEFDVWGPEEVLAKLSASDLRCVVDCSGVKLSTGYAPARFYVQDHDYLLVNVEWGNVFISVQNAEN